MAEPFIGEIKIVPYNWAQRDWAKCDGTVLEISQNQALFAVINTDYGGNGTTTFALPDMRGRTPVHPGDEIQLGQSNGQEYVSLNESTLPSHKHTMVVDSDAPNAVSPVGSVLATGQKVTPYLSDGTEAALNENAVDVAGGGSSHYNMQPSLVLNFVISLKGIFPSRQ